MQKAPYTAPALRAHGHVESITKAQGQGGSLDMTFSAGTPFGDLTFSD